MPRTSKRPSKLRLLAPVTSVGLPALASSFGVLKFETVLCDIAHRASCAAIAPVWLPWAVIVAVIGSVAASAWLYYADFLRGDYCIESIVRR